MKILAVTFRGGVRLPESKYTENVKIEKLDPPDFVAIPLNQHIGTPCEPLVKPGDRVLMGQVIGDVPAGALGVPVHASVSGTVKEIMESNLSGTRKVRSIVIENDKTNELSPDIHPFTKSLRDTETEEIIDIVRRAGISGMGGASFPTYAKIRSALGKVDTIIINCAECEPFITANHRLLLEDPASVINGVKILMRALGVKTVYIAIEKNKQDAAKKLRSLLEKTRTINVVMLKTKYPQGDERQLIYALTKRQVPVGKLPADVGCVVFNAETCSAVYNAFANGMPLIRRIVTVDGDCVRNPGNFLVPIGTPVSFLFECCGGFVLPPEKIIFGGPMMGIAKWNIGTPVTKGTSAVLALSPAYNKSYNAEVCIRCGRCVAGCPMHLMPIELSKLSAAGKFEEAKKMNVMSCVECGSCSYVCPGGVPILQNIKVAKDRVRSMK